MVAASPGERNGAVQLIVWPEGEPQLNATLLTPASVAVADETVLLTAMLLAPAGPLLLTVIVKATGSPALTLFGDAVIDSATSAVAMAIGTVAELLELQEPLVAVTPRVTLPLAPAVKEIAFVPAPAVIVPLPMVQLYVVPEVNGTDAPLLDDPGSTEDGALIVEDGVGVTATACEVVALQPPALVTVTL
jgi:hypothetical protein